MWNNLHIFAILYVGKHMDKLRYKRTCVFNTNYHIVWSTKYRRKVLTPNIEIGSISLEAIKRYIQNQEKE
jgi:REP element-mobilizing transposase RayT